MNRKPTRAEDRARMVEQGIRLAWESLESHLIRTYQDGRESKKRGETVQFHKKCIREYAELIDILSRLY